MAAVNNGSNKYSKRDIRREFSDQVIERIEAGTAPWQTVWPASHQKKMPYNAFSGLPYAGSNLLLLSCALQFQNDPRWLTFKQARMLGAQVVKDSKSSMIEYWRWYDEKEVIDEVTLEKTMVEEKRDNPIVMRKAVFNAEQTVWLGKYEEKCWKELTPEEMYEKGNAVIKNSGAVFAWDGEEYYDEVKDVVHLLAKKDYKNTYNAYLAALRGAVERQAVLGHKIEANPPSEQKKALKELILNIAMYFLAHDVGIGFTKAYIDARKDNDKKFIALLEDKNTLFNASRIASKISSRLLAGLEIGFNENTKEMKSQNHPKKPAEPKAKKEKKPLAKSGQKKKVDSTPIPEVVPSPIPADVPVEEVAEPVTEYQAHYEPAELKPERGLRNAKVAEEHEPKIVEKDFSDRMFEPDFTLEDEDTSIFEGVYSGSRKVNREAEEELQKSLGADLRYEYHNKACDTVLEDIFSKKQGETLSDILHVDSMNKISEMLEDGEHASEREEDVIEISR